MKTKEELKKLKEEVEALNKKLAELNEEELKQVAGGWIFGPTTFMVCSNCKHTDIWNGVYSGTYECPECHEMSFSPL